MLVSELDNDEAVHASFVVVFRGTLPRNAHIQNIITETRPHSWLLFVSLSDSHPEYICPRIIVGNRSRDP
jgi:hypothetical protein